MSEQFTLASAGRAIDGAISRMVHGLVTPSARPAGERMAGLEDYRGARNGTLSIIQNLSQNQSDFRSSQNSWSIGQNVEHLLLIEDLYRGYMQDLIALARKGGKTDIDLTFREINTTIAFIPRDVIPLFSTPLKVFNMFVPRPVRETMFRMPFIPAVAPTVSDPAPSRPIEQLRLRCTTSFAATEALFRGDLPPNVDAVTMTHPLLGTNNIGQIFRIIAAHEERHHRQMRGVVQNSRFPKR